MLKSNIIVQSPGKLILSGEHAVLYNNTGLAIAINQYTTVEISQNNKLQIKLTLEDLDYADNLTVTAMNKLNASVKQRYLQFLYGNLNISQVITKPFELLNYAIAAFLPQAFDSNLGLDIKVSSNLPIGCGMGSSSASIVAITHALNALTCCMSSQQLFDFNTQVEAMQHGASSGIDILLSTNGGGVFLEQATKHSFTSLDFPLYIVNTGKPANTTGEVVAKVQDVLSADASLLDDFKATAYAMHAALLSQDYTKFVDSINYNQKLLEYINVVPTRVKKFIANLHAQGVGAKLCGAGSLADISAGVVVLTSLHSGLSEMVGELGFKLETIQMDKCGTKII